MTKQNPTPKQSTALAQQRDHGDELRGWFQFKAKAAVVAGAGRISDLLGRLRKKKPDQVPTYRSPLAQVPGNVDVPKPQHLVEHADATRDVRRRRGLDLGTGTLAGTNRPYRNPARAAKLARAGRLRKDLP